MCELNVNRSLKLGKTTLSYIKDFGNQHLTYIFQADFRDDGDLSLILVLLALLIVVVVVIEDG